MRTPPLRRSKHSSQQEASFPRREGGPTDGVPSPPAVPGDTTDLPAHTAKGGTNLDSNVWVWPPVQGSQRGGNPTSWPGLRENPLPPLPPHSLLRSTLCRDASAVWVPFHSRQEGARVSHHPTSQCPPSGAPLASPSQSSCLFPHPFWAGKPLIPEQPPASPGMGWEGRVAQD